MLKQIIELLTNFLPVVRDLKAQILEKDKIIADQKALLDSEAANDATRDNKLVALEAQIAASEVDTAAALAAAEALHAEVNANPNVPDVDPDFNVTGPASQPVK